MYPIDNATKALFDAEKRQVLRITGIDPNGNAIKITEADVKLGTFAIDRYCCNGGKLEVGTAVAAEMKVKLLIISALSSGWLSSSSSLVSPQ